MRTLSLPADIRKRYGLSKDGEILAEDGGGEIVLRTVDQAVARSQALSRRLLAGQDGAAVSDFLTERRLEAEAE